MRRIILAVLLFVPLFSLTSHAAVPVIYCTDLNHPHGDPDDHFDLATLFALDEFDVRAIVLDNVISQDERPGAIPVRQMLRLTGRDVPFAVGLTKPLASMEDEGRTEEKRFQAGVELILKTLEEAEEPVTVITAGALRDMAAAFNRNPELFRKKVGRLYINIGNTFRERGRAEYNAGLDPYAYARIMGSGLPVYWCPCFSGRKQGNGKGYATYWAFPHEEILPHIPVPLQNFFIFALTKPEGVDPITFLTAKQDAAQRDAVWKLRRNMWCTAPFFHAAGRNVYRLDNGDYAALSEQSAKRMGVTKNRIEAYTFEPARLEVLPSEISQKNRTVGIKLEFGASNPNIHIFRQTDDDYQKIMTSCLRKLFEGFPVSRQVALLSVSINRFT